MSYAKQDGKDKVLFVDKDYVEQQPEIEVPKSNEQESKGEENDQAAAFDPETGEINWDCPCLGGMAQGPCGEEFKAAFSCFVYSNAEPKGVDCVDKFRDMQNCFRQHPDVYGDEIDDDDDDEEEEEKKEEQESPKPEVKEEKEEQESSSSSSVAASSVLEEGENNGISSWIASWF